jgi:PAS domain S-box-containing protein
VGEDSSPGNIEDFEDLFETAPCGYISAQANGRITKVNQTFATWVGHDRAHLAGRRFSDLLNIAGKIYYETHFAPLLRMQGFFNEVALELVCADGAVLPVLVNAVERRDSAGTARFIRMTIFAAPDRRRYEQELLEARRATERANADLHELNLTLETRIADAVQERLKAEEALRQSQKMEAVGQLTGGLAHDFNNLLTGIMGSLEMLQSRLSQGRIGDVERYIVAAQGASKRAAALTHRLLAFSRQQALDPKPTGINRLVAGLEELIRRTTGPAVTLEVVMAGGLWTTLVDPNQLENALLNLCVNARDAMPQGGRLTIETGNRWLDHRTASERDLPPGQYVSLCVSDTGTGIPPEVVSKVFDPFFTTKPPGQGTGLGLSMVYGFARQSGGQVRIYSELGQGTMVCLYLPRHHGEEDGPERVAEPAAAPRAEQGETVLVVDDEPTVRMLVSDILDELGYTAIEAADGPAGLAILNSDVRIDLLITDVGLPGGMNGRQMVDAARTARPGLKVLFITGYAENAVVGHGHLEPGMHVLTKPLAMKALAIRIKSLIGEA